MKCERTRELVSDALDGVLTPGIADRFHAHLDACLPCRTFHAELKESLLLLEELPTIEVGDEFDRAVWARIRTDEKPLPIAAALRERLEMLRIRFSFGTGLWRWSPAFAAALVLLGVAVTSPPVTPAPPDPQVGTDSPRAGTDGMVASNVDGPSSPMPVDSGNAEVAEARPGFQEQEYVSGMPRAVEHYLESGRDLRFANSDRYENSNYSYPLRQIPDPGFAEPGFASSGRVSGLSSRRVGTPVGATAPANPAGGEARVTVLEF